MSEPVPPAHGGGDSSARRRAASAAARGEARALAVTPGPHGLLATPPRSGLARTAPAAARVEQGRMAQPVGWWGMALFLCAEATLFGVLIGSYFYLDYGSSHWPPLGIKPPEPAIPLLLTSILVATSVPMALASRAAIASAKRAAIRLLALSAFVQSGYLAYQMELYTTEIHQFHPQGSAYASIYFVLLAFHHAHVLLGILINLSLVWWLSHKGLTNYRLIGVRTAALYWHVINAIAVAVVLTQLTPSI